MRLRRPCASTSAHSNRFLALYDQPALDADAIVKEYAPLAARFAPFVADTTALVHAALERGDHVLAEGAQGTLLDIDHGTYPFVTSSSTITGGVLTSLGVGPKHVKRVIGVAKAFCSRVGAGPFPTELLDEMGARLRGTGANPWDEYGSTTGRPRRTGWLDLVALKYSARVNGLTEIVLTKLDILTGIHPLRVCIAYSYRDEPISNFPSDLSRAGAMHAHLQRTARLGSRHQQCAPHRGPAAGRARLHSANRNVHGRAGVACFRRAGAIADL